MLSNRIWTRFIDGTIYYSRPVLLHCLLGFCFMSSTYTKFPIFYYLLFPVCHYRLCTAYIYSPVSFSFGFFFVYPFYICVCFFFFYFFQLFVACLEAIQAENILTEIDPRRLFSNVRDIYEANIKFWTMYLYPMVRIILLYIHSTYTFYQWFFFSSHLTIYLF